MARKPTEQEKQMAALVLQKLHDGDTAGATKFNAILERTMQDNDAAAGDELDDPLK